MLVTTDDIRKYRPIALNLDDEKRLLTYIREAEQLDIIPAIGAPLYKELSEQAASHTLLLEGGYYHNNEKVFAGLKAALSLLAYARFILNNAVNATPFGVQRKSALDSDPVDDKTLFRHANEARNTGLAYLNQCLDYIGFNSCKCSSKAHETKSKFKSIGQ